MIDQAQINSEIKGQSLVNRVLAYVLGSDRPIGKSHPSFVIEGCSFYFQLYNTANYKL